MPIHGLTTDIQPRFPRLGKLRKGGEKVNGQYGPDLDHFRFTSERPEIVDAFVAAYGETPRSIQVYLPYPTPEQAFPTWAEIWGSSGLVHRCDGVNMVMWQENGKYVKGTKPCSGGHEKNDYLNDAIGRLDVIIPELVEAGYVGYVTLETHGKNDIVNILGVLHAVYGARKGNELGLRGIMFNLRRVKENISIPGYGKTAGKRTRADKWLVKLEPVADWVRLQIEMSHAAQMAGELPAWTENDVVIDAPQSTPALPPGDLDYVDPVLGDQPGAPDPVPANVKTARPALVSKPTNPPANQPSINSAANMVTSKGNRFGDLTDEQLQTIVSKLSGNTDKLSKDMVAAATLLLAEADGDAWAAMTALAEQAHNAGIQAPELNHPVSTAVMRRHYLAIAQQLQDMAEVEGQIPAIFR